MIRASATLALTFLLPLFGSSTACFAEADAEAIAEEAAKSAVQACSKLALSEESYRQEGFYWAGTCAEKVHQTCLDKLAREGGVTSRISAAAICFEAEARAWETVADLLLARLRERWTTCQIDENDRTQMILRLDRLNNALHEITIAHCDYDGGQWRALGQPNIAEIRTPRCMAAGEVSRADAVFAFLLKGPGCE